MLQGNHRSRSISLAFFLFGLIASSSGCAVDAAQVEISSSPTRVASPESTLTATPTETQIETPFTATWTPTDTLTPTSTGTYKPTSTASPTPTSSSPTPTSTLTTTPTPGTSPSGTLELSGAPRTAKVPILMYHHVVVAPPGTNAVGVDLSVPPEVFDSEIKFLNDRGFHTIHLTDLVNNLQTGSPLPPKPIVITFDDGYDDNYLNAFPTLKEYGFVGSFFIIRDRPDASVPGYMTWQQIEEMASNGMEIGSHSLDHRFNLGEISSAAQWGEIKPSYDAIVEHIPNQAPVFAYPSGSYNATTLNYLRQLGYVAAVTTRQGVTQSSTSPLELGRVRIRGEWSINEFVYWLNYWVGGL